MISYREKQLLAAMKYSQDGLDSLNAELEKALGQAESGEAIETSGAFYDGEPPQDMEQLYERAKNAGFDSWTRASDLLSNEELADLKRRKRQIEAEFRDKTRLRDADYAFLIGAVLLQLGKQIVLKYDLFQHTDGATKTEEKYKKKYDRNRELRNDITKGLHDAKRFYAPYRQIIMTKSVPYDIVKGTKHFGNTLKETRLRLSGDNHRFKSVGHDPVLGLYFGTANILTNTATFYPDPALANNEITKYLNYLGMVSYHVKYGNASTYSDPHIASYASNLKIGEHVLDRAKHEPKAFLAALGKEIAHIRSDRGSIAGIPIPFATQVFGAEKAEEWAKKGLDWSHFLNIPVLGAQAGIAAVFNLIIGSLHKAYLLWDELKGSPSVRDAIERIKQDKYNQLMVLDHIRTNKILMISNSIASTVNLAVCVGGGAISAYAGNEKLSMEFFSHLDIGGLMVTLYKLFHDGTYILKVKDDFIKSNIHADFERRLKEIENGAVPEGTDLC